MHKLKMSDIKKGAQLHALDPVHECVVRVQLQPLHLCEHTSIDQK